MKEIFGNAVFINFDYYYCTTSDEILNSDIFKYVLNKFCARLERKKPSWWHEYTNSFKYEDLTVLVDDFIQLFKTLLIFDVNTIADPLTIDKINLQHFIEGLYDYWRRYERYTHIKTTISNNIKNLIELDQKFCDLILQTYRRISENVRGQRYLVYRQLNAGSNAAIATIENNFNVPEEYHLSDVIAVASVMLHPPFIIYPKNTKRDGIFEELKVNPLLDCPIPADEFLCYPIYVGKLIAFVYFHQQYTSLGVSLANLFEPCPYNDYKDKKPDLLFVYGIENIEAAGFYKDIKNDIYLGFTPKIVESTYFGYMKKMLLTLHNLKCIEEGCLPLHGAMVSILFPNNRRVNIALVGDSGAGKSETLEALRSMADEDISELLVVFDDMGYLSIKDDEIKAYGTEIGAFVRLDDLEAGYAYKEMDRSIFMNPDRHNARAIIPVSDYHDIIHGHKLDLLLYANNYEDKIGIHFFNNTEEAINCFKLGKRMAMQTTSEKGIVTSYFANPFGPLQKKQQCDLLLEQYFNALKEKNILIGEMYTRLGLDRHGPVEAAKALLEVINKSIK